MTVTQIFVPHFKSQSIKTTTKLPIFHQISATYKGFQMDYINVVIWRLVDTYRASFSKYRILYWRESIGMGDIQQTGIKS